MVFGGLGFRLRALGGARNPMKMTTKKTLQEAGLYDRSIVFADHAVCDCEMSRS